MPIPGLSLMGFMCDVAAIEYQRTQCISDDTSDGTLLANWQAARDLLGPANPQAGKPRTGLIPAKHNAYLDGVERSIRFPLIVQNMSWSFRMVEIAPLLAYQFHVATDRARTGADATQLGLSRGQLLHICMPQDVPMPNVSQPQMGSDGKSIIIASPDLNVLPFPAVPGEKTDERVNLLVFPFGIIAPLVQVVRFQDRYYLKNGYHRAVHLGLLGYKEMPCILLEATSYEQVGPTGDGVFPPSLLESENPPTCGHFIQHRACAVNLRKMKRLLRFTLSAEVEPEE